MGGDHHHHEPAYKVPDYRIFKVDAKSPELVKIQEALAAQGLKDPWLRNEVWRYNRDIIGPRDWKATWGTYIFRRAGTGLLIAIGIVAAQKSYDAFSGGAHADHGNHGDHH